MTIKQKQCLLTYLGYDTGGIDGIWGIKSMTATEKFQNDYGLGTDGIFGPSTEKKILEVIASGTPPMVTPEDKPDGVPETGTFWDGVKHFRREEFRCPCSRCGGFPKEPDGKLVRLADQVREHFDAPMTISSGVRCQAHNDELKGSAKNSYHVRGKAIDFTVRGYTASQVLVYVRTLPVHYAYAIDGSYVHMDVE